MNRIILVKALFFGFSTVGLWVLLVVIYLFNRQEISSNVTPCFGTCDKLFISHTDIYNMELDTDIKSEVTLHGLNRHSWEKYCQTSLEQICNYPIFPKAPDTREYIPNVDITSDLGRLDYVNRLLGYIRPNVSGEHQFLVTSNGLAEVWLSPNANWKDAQRIAYIRPQSSPLKKLSFEGIKSQISDSVKLAAKQRYYFEVIYFQSQSTATRSKHVIQVAWKRPDSRRFEIIDGKFYLLYTKDIDKAKLKVLDDELPKALICAQSRTRFANRHLRPETLPYLEKTAVEKALPICDYKPSYLLDSENLPRDFKHYSGVHRYVQKTYTYPFPSLNGVIKSKTAQKAFIAGYPLNEKEALSVVTNYFNTVKRIYPRKYELLSVRRVEKKEDLLKGDRYLIEVVVKYLPNGASYILAEYVFQPKNLSGPLCYASGLQWDRTADVYLILTAKNLGRWVHHFIKNVEQIIKETKDEHLHVVIFDFGSPDIDLEQALKKSSLKNYHFIVQPGNYSRTLSFGRAVQSIKDPNAIIVTIDMHLDLGSQLIDDIRKHCIKGKMLYAPQIVYLYCNGTSAVPIGRWYHYSYGTVAVYKEDWDKFGGFSKDFETKVTWGGEDWDLVDGAVRSGLEVERTRCPSIYHYYHSKKGMWIKTEKPKLANAAKPTPKTAKLVPKRAKPMPKTAKPIPKFAKPMPKIAKPIPKFAKPMPKIAKPMPKMAKPIPKTAKMTPMTAKLTRKKA
ncbi:beta-1,4-N-acetylgalactosaminyltransferase 3-like [Stylophora pistillata]|uniref:beta-1,4-N-acetylgalactosaminyltransferase 3-like n=1 Tax=Stylophora pistillata TaxID=50429 RepID=UPI000C0424BF|nr:beta-1,4-N-acetylgalactosaminyltransferase 3-like [Stylophora pistillata]